jgi:YHS domain-containing protein
MMVGDGAAGRFSFEGEEFWFCSRECLQKFLQEPRRFADQAHR